MEDTGGIWLEVVDVRFESGTDSKCTVLLKADKAYPKPVWWPVADDALITSAENRAFETYKAILKEVDQKRTALAWLGCSNDGKHLHCKAFRFQSAELGSR